MKMMKKLAVAILAMMLVCPCFANVAYAADGVSFFTDLETKVGETFTVTGTVVNKVPGDNVLGNTVIEMTYDTTYMRFVSGDEGVVDANGTITFNGTGDGTSDRLEFNMTFQALQEGSTTMNQTSATVETSTGTPIADFTLGYAAITIAEGDPSLIVEPAEPAATVDINGVTYTVAASFPETAVPAGFTTTELTYNNITFSGITQETSGVKAAYLVSPEGESKFWIFDEVQNMFYPYEELVISDTYSIVVLNGTEEVKMPSKYTVASIEINGTDFPVWMEPNREGFYIFYAVNTDGVKSLYLYDSVEHTYQRMEVPTATESVSNDATGMNKVLSSVSDHLIWFLVGVSCAGIILLIITITLAIKLKHRNLELDDLYEEFGLDDDEEETTTGGAPKPAPAPAAKKEEKKVEKKAVKPAAKKAVKPVKPVMEEEYEEEDFYEEDDLAELRRDFTGSKGESAKKVNYEEFYDEDDFEEEEVVVRRPARKKARKDDTFEMNFIDLD